MAGKWADSAKIVAFGGVELNLLQKKGLELGDKTFLHELFAKMVPIDCEYSQSSVLFNHEQSCGLYRKTKPVANHKRLST